MHVRNHGKYTKLDRRNPRGLGVCDYSGFIVRHADLRRQMEYRGRGLVWTGFWVHYKFLDLPNPQNLTPIITMDPVPLKNPRPDPELGNITVPTANIDVSGNDNITLSDDQYDNTILNFIGTLTGNIIVYVPALYNQFYANNLTSGDFTLSLAIPFRLQPPLLISPADPITQTGPFVNNDGINLSILPGE